MSGTRFGAVILAGGKSSRMGGVDKAGLAVSGESMIGRVVGQLSDFDEVLLSVDRADRHAGLELPVVLDAKPGCGPLAGIVAALGACRSDALFAVAADMPLFERGLARYVTAFFAPGCLAVTARDRGGRVHPLCAVYAKAALPVLKRQLDAGEYRLGKALRLLDAREAPLEYSVFADDVVSNINTPEEYAALRRRVDGPLVVAVSGVKNSGKTTLLERILPLLAAAGLRVGVVKHDGHDFVPDGPGTDSFRLRTAGARMCGVYSDSRFMVTGESGDGDSNMRAVMSHFGDVDLVLYEGGKASAYPKIEVVRAAAGGGSVCVPETLLAVCSDCGAAVPGVASFGLDEYEKVAAVILDFYRERRSDA